MNCLNSHILEHLVEDLLARQANEFACQKPASIVCEIYIFKYIVFCLYLYVYTCVIHNSEQQPQSDQLSDLDRWLSSLHPDRRYRRFGRDPLCL